MYIFSDFWYWIFPQRNLCLRERSESSSWIWIPWNTLDKPGCMKEHETAKERVKTQCQNELVNNNNNNNK